MSEYQYYEILAIDRPLDRSAQEGLRSISHEVEAEIARRNPAGYEKAMLLLSDLAALAIEESAESALRRIVDIRARHGTKQTSLDRLDKLRL
ncbi:hypothetical protein [Bradyrhizobium sp. STM 3557]|uniref:hypothetical protein n=1 Tax=Bradyrhizobium sp. STM 3557 TaxID=578920 RepID=UPI00388EBC6E